MKLKKVKQKTFPCKFGKSGKDFRETVEKIAKRIQIHLRAVEKEYFKKFGKKHFRHKLRRDFGHSFYAGKLYAYLWVLLYFNSKVPNKIFKERGVRISNDHDHAFELLPYLYKQRKK